MHRSGLFFLALMLGGCQSSEIQEYEVDAEDDQIFTSDLLKQEFPELPFRWDVPDTWQVASNDRFSRIAWQVGTDSSAARVTVTELAMAAGLEPQIARWQAQVNAPDPDGRQTQQLNLASGQSATLVNLSGPEESIFGLLIEAEPALWVFKFRGNKDVATAEQQRFEEFCRSVELLPAASVEGEERGGPE